MEIVQIPIHLVPQAWKDGAYNLVKAVERAKREITGDQLKMLLLRGERALVAMVDNQTAKAWAAVQLQVLPNIRVLYIYAIYAPGETSEEAFNLLKQYAKANGCETIRGSCDDANGRLWRMRYKLKPIYSVYEFEVE